MTYIICDIFHREMVEKLPSPHTYLLLGDAYMNIQEVCKIHVLFYYLMLSDVIRIL